MAIGDFRWRVPGSEDQECWRRCVAANGNINLDVYIEIQTGTDPETWALLPQGHRTIVLQAQAIVAIAEGSGTIQQKRQQVMNLITDAILGLGLVHSYQGAAAFVSLLPNGEWPTNDITESIEL